MLSGGSECNIHSAWRYCTTILLKGLNVKIVLIKLVDDLLPLEIGAEPLTYGGMGKGVRARERRGVFFSKQEHIMKFEHFCFVGPTST